MCIVLTFMSTIVIKSEQNFTEHDEVVVNVVLFLTQGVVMVYCLLVVSLRNLKKMVKEVRWPLFGSCFLQPSSPLGGVQAEKEIDDEMELKSLEENKKASTLTTYEEARELMKAPQRSLAFKFFDEDGSLGVGPDEFCDVAGRMEPYAWLRPEAERDKPMLQLDTLKKQLLEQAAVQPGVSSHSCWRHGGDADI